MWWNQFATQNADCPESSSREITWRARPSASVWKTDFKPPKLCRTTCRPNPESRRYARQSSPNGLSVRKRPFVAHVQTHTAALASLAISPAVVLSFQNQRRHFVWLAIQIDGQQRDVSAAGVFAFACQNVLRKHFHTHFH